MAHMLPLSATAGVDGKLIIWDTASLSVRATCQHPEVCSATPSCQPAGLACSFYCQLSASLHLFLCLFWIISATGPGSCKERPLTGVPAGCCGNGASSIQATDSHSLFGWAAQMLGRT